MTSYHEYNKYDKAKVLVDKMLSGSNIALITDAGTPGISDPGEVLVSMCIENKIPVTSLPGASAVLTALTISGRATRRFAFEAFLPTEKKERNLIIDELKSETRTIIIYEAPHHLLATLKVLQSALGDDRGISICKELTKKHENMMFTTLSQAVDYYSDNEPRGEYVLVIEGRSFEEIAKEQAMQWERMTIEEHYDYYMSQGIDSKEAMKMVAKDRGISKRDVYGVISIK